MKSSILLCILCLSVSIAYSQSSANTPQSCVQQYLNWKNAPSTVDSHALFHPKLTLHWEEQGKKYEQAGHDYLQKINAGKQLDRQMELLSLQERRKRANALIEAYYSEEELLVQEHLNLVKKGNAWQILKITFQYESLAVSPDYTSRTNRYSSTHNEKVH